MRDNRRYKLLVRIFDLSQRSVDYLYLLLTAGLNGLWLGVLSRDTLHLIDKVYYDKHSSNLYCNESYNKSGLRRWEKAMVEQYFQSCKSLLVAGIGGGREVLALQKLGYEVVGFECHPQLLDIARELLIKENCTPSVYLAPRDQCHANGHIYNGLIIGWGAYCHIQGRERRVEFLKNLRAQVRECSPILLSFLARSRTRKYLRVVFMIGNSIRRILRRDRLELGDDLIPTFVHYFSEKEIAEELRDAGFELKFYSTKSYGHAVGVAI